MVMVKRKIFSILIIFFLLPGILINGIMTEACLCIEPCSFGLQNEVDAKENSPFHSHHTSGHCKSCNVEAVDLIFGGMADALAKGERVEIRGFGSFKVKHYDGYQGRNPKTGEVLNVKPKKMPFFKCGKELRGTVDVK
jgi:integration host factor subunit beta